VTTLALDTSVAVPLMMRSTGSIGRWSGGVPIVRCD